VLIVPVVVIVIAARRSLIICASSARAHWNALVLAVDNAWRRLAVEEAGIGVGGRCERVALVAVVVFVLMVVLILVVLVLVLALVQSAESEGEEEAVAAGPDGAQVPAEDAEERVHSVALSFLVCCLVVGCVLGSGSGTVAKGRVAQWRTYRAVKGKEDEGSASREMLIRLKIRPR
jgi:hypothetical protein